MVAKRAISRLKELRTTTQSLKSCIGREYCLIIGYANMVWRSVAVFLIVCGRGGNRARPRCRTRLSAVVAPFFRTYCNRCHDGKVQKGEFRLDTLSSDFTLQAEAERWSEIRFRMNSGEMPPKSEPQPKAEELAKIVEWISARLAEGEAARMAKRGPIAYYRLSREEYANTIQDLLGVHYDPLVPGALNEDPRWHGFERIGSQLTLSPSHVERYLKAAEEVVESAFPEQGNPSKQSVLDPTKGKERWLEERGLKGPVRTLLWPNRRLGTTIFWNGVHRDRQARSLSFARPFERRASSRRPSPAPHSLEHSAQNVGVRRGYPRTGRRADHARMDSTPFGRQLCALEQYARLR